MCLWAPGLIPLDLLSNSIDFALLDVSVARFSEKTFFRYTLELFGMPSDCVDLCDRPAINVLEMPRLYWGVSLPRVGAISSTLLSETR